MADKENIVEETKVMEAQIPMAEETTPIVEAPVSMSEFVKLMEEMKELRQQLADNNVDKTAVATTEVAKTETDISNDWLNERIPYIAFKDNDKYKDDIHVGINGHNYLIQRGIQVMIPRFVYMAIQDSDKQTLEADMSAEVKAREFDNESKKLGFNN